ncbi:uncharacterized protein LODBEIA_P07790 [Lodderomyces beijingensis]|uniref:Uncharacterized protein n=1 Tax=Lodderomyces beijingensis TaxID=1775926 RepID=A0ABP0ZJT6_9ASCO
MKSKRYDKIYNCYAIGICLSLLGFAAGMEMNSYSCLKSYNVFSTFYGFPTKIEANLLNSSNYFGAIGSYRPSYRDKCKPPYLSAS